MDTTTVSILVLMDSRVKTHHLQGRIIHQLNVSILVLMDSRVKTKKDKKLLSDDQ